MMKKIYRIIIVTALLLSAFAIPAFADSPQYPLTWSRSGDELYLHYGFANHVAYCYDELGQIRLPIEDYLFYFTAG